ETRCRTLSAWWRRAVGRAAPTAARHRETLHHVEQAVEHFVERELVALLDEAGVPGKLRVAGGEHGGNRIRVHIANADLPGAAIIAFEEQSAWLLGSMVEPG